MKYDMTKPLEPQIAGCEEVVINYEPNDIALDKFLQEMDKCAKTGIDFNFSIKCIHNNYLNGKKTEKIANKIVGDMNVNELMKLLVLNHANTDQKLEDMIKICKGKNCDV